MRQPRRIGPGMLVGRRAPDSMICGMPSTLPAPGCLSSNFGGGSVTRPSRLTTRYVGRAGLPSPPRVQTDAITAATTDLARPPKRKGATPLA